MGGTRLHLARRKFLFSGSGNGARASCFILSLIETAKQNGIAPEDYLRCFFEKAHYAETENEWEKLLLWNIEITPYKIPEEEYLFQKAHFQNYYIKKEILLLRFYTAGLKQ